MTWSGEFAESISVVDSILLDVFGRTMDVQGTQVLAVVDEDRYQERVGRQNNSEYAEEVWRSGQVLMCRLDTLGFRPEYGDQLAVEGKDWTVTDVILSGGLLEITLETNES